MSTSLTVGQLAEHLQADLVGDPDGLVTGAAPLDSAGRNDVSFLASRRYIPHLPSTEAGAVIIGRDLGELREAPGSAVLWVDDAHLALAKTLGLLYPETAPRAEIHASAIVEQGAELGRDVAIGPFAVIGSGTKLGDGVCVGSHSVVGERCEVGAATVIKDHVVLYANTAVGERCIIHSGSSIGVDGFGYVFHENAHRKIPQVGRCIIEDDVEIGANVCIDRGSVGETRVGAGTKIDNLVHVAHNVKIGRNCVIVAQVGIAGSSSVGDGVALAGQVGIIGHLKIGDGARVAAQSGVSHDIPAGETWFGYPARPRTEVLRANAAMLKLPDLIKRVRRLEQNLDNRDA
jgi:UDP-3-O-[3-hydroxymyristoyl] glucosamine N-acyltransferase